MHARLNGFFLPNNLVKVSVGGVKDIEPIHCYWKYIHGGVKKGAITILLVALKKTDFHTNLFFACGLNLE